MIICLETTQLCSFKTKQNQNQINEWLTKCVNSKTIQLCSFKIKSIKWMSNKNMYV